MRLPALPAGLSAGGRAGSWVPRPAAWVLLDVDGTLLSADGVRPRVREAVAGLVATGTLVGLATGRMRQAAVDLVADLQLNGPHVFHNGAEVHDGQASLATFPLTDDAVAAVRRISAQRDSYAELYVDRGFVVTRDEPRAREHWATLGRPPLGPVDVLGGEPVLKATFMCFDDAEADAVVADLAAAGMQPGPAHSPATPGVTYVNATGPAVDKGSAVASAASKLGIALESVAAVGDGPNDVPLLLPVGTAVAMGQADDTVRASAHLVAPSVEEDGAAVAIDALRDLVASR